MQDSYISKLENKSKIWEIDEKIVNNELKIHKYESRRLIIKKCIQEMENKYYHLKNKASKYPESEKIVDELEDTEKRIKKGQKALKKLNEKLPRIEVGLIRFKQDKKEEIKIGLVNYMNSLNLKYEKLHHGDQSLKDNKKKLEGIVREIEYIKRLIQTESYNK